jgi:hypothetical protein
MPQTYLATDKELIHREPGSAALTADTTIDTIDQLAAVRTEYTTRIYVESIAIDGNDERYQFRIELSDDNFDGGGVEDIAAMYDLGATQVRTGGLADSAAGDYIEMHWCTEQNEVSYRYWRLVLDGTGSTFSIAFNAVTTPRAFR